LSSYFVDMALIFLSSVTKRRARSRVDIKLSVGRLALSSQSAARSGQWAGRWSLSRRAMLRRWGVDRAELVEL
jgi:hypothetical protein